MHLKAIQEFFKNIHEFPKTLKQSVVRHDKPTSERARSQIVFGNIFFHILSTRIHRYSLKKAYTFGLGVIAASSFVILLVTGILLMVYYKPSVELAYDSIKDIHFIVPGGRFIRNVHRWATNVMIVTVFLHMARVFYTAAYKKGRAFNWLLGILLLVLTLLLGFTGYLLPWDQLAYWAITIATNIAASTRELTDALNFTHYFDPGGFMKVLLLGSESIGEEALIRFYWLHCIILPFAMMMVLAVHFWRIRKDGGLARPDHITEKDLEGTPEDPLSDKVFTYAPEKTYGLMCLVKGKSPAVNRGPEQTVSSWPHLVIRIVTLFMLTFAFTCLYALWLNAPLKELANPAVPENPAKAPWYFLGLQELVSYSAFMGGVGIPALALLGLALIPYLDRRDQEIGRWFDNKEGKQVAICSFVFSSLTVIGMLAFTVKFGWLRNWFPQIPQLVITFINPGTVLVACFVSWSFYWMGKDNSIRMAAIALFTCFLVGFVILTYFATYHRGPNWEFYWLQSQWPGH
ncbi:MAG: cytochrome b N-terminal domain-containing protein [Candidatus Omnitrophica bacterium]|nr:cytochrome b N-terminal domain-containing protein [Candidatus Omnitrophota bacterium]